MIQPSAPPSFSVFPIMGKLHLEVDSMKADFARVPVRTVKAGESAVNEAGLATFQNFNGTYAASREFYRPICGEPPEIEKKSAKEIGDWILTRLARLGQLISTIRRAGVLTIDPRKQEIFNALKLIEQKSPEWTAAQQLTPSRYLYCPKTKDLSLSTRVCPGNRVFVNIKYKVFESQKKVGVLLDLSQNKTFISLKPNRKHKKEPIGNILKCFSAEMEFNKRLIEEHRKSTDLEGILVPEMVLDQDKRVMIITPQKGYDLKEYRERFTFPSSAIPKIVFKIIKGAKRFQDIFGVNHGDLKPRNYLVDEDFNVFLIDFGMIRPRGKGVMEKLMGSPGYLPPEAFGGFPSEIDYDKWCAWALGVVLYWAIYGPPAFYASGLKLSYSQYMTELNSVQKMNMEHQFESVIKGLLHPNPTQRLSIDEAFDIVSITLGK